MLVVGGGDVTVGKGGMCWCSAVTQYDSRNDILIFGTPYAHRTVYYLDLSTSICYLPLQLELTESQQ